MKPFWLVLALVPLAAAWRAKALGRTGRVIAGLVAIVLLLLGSGVLELPSIETIVDEVGGRLGNWTYLLVGVNAFLETGAFLGFIAPGETMVLFGGVLAGAGTISLVPLIAVVWSCSLLGDLTAYGVGRRYGRDFLLRHGARVRIGEPQVQVVEGFFVRHGDLTLLLGRWIGVVRPLVPFLAGSSRLSFPRFVAVDVLSTFLWSAALCTVGAAFWRNFDEVVAIVSRTLFVFGAVVFVAVVVTTAVATRRSARRSAAVDRWIEGQLTERPLIGRPAAAAWLLVTRLEPHVPGRRRSRRPEAAEPDTVPEASPPPAGAGDPADHPSP